MSELLAAVSQLQDLSPDYHWFCDKCENIEAHAKDDTAIQRSGTTRSEHVTQCFHLFAYDNSELNTKKQFLTSNVDRFLSQCEDCVIGYYKAKQQMIEKLHDEYDDGEVEIFAEIFERFEMDRITKGLAAAAAHLDKLEHSNRRYESLLPAEALALFECMNNERFLRNSDMLNTHLRPPFQVLSNPTSIVRSFIVPGMTIFLFETDEMKSRWALQCWMENKSQLSTEEFDYAVKNGLKHFLKLSALPIPDQVYFERLWCGLRVIVERLSQDLITHSLRALDIDVCRLSIDHLQVDTAAIRFILQTTSLLLQKAPKDFWSSMGTISPTNFVEQAFNNRQLRRYLKEEKDVSDYDASPVHDMLCWIHPFVLSLSINEQAGVVRSMVTILLQFSRGADYTALAKQKCLEATLQTLSDAATSAANNTDKLDAASRTGFREIQSIIASQADLLVPLLSHPNATLSSLASQTVQRSISADCKALVAEYAKVSRDPQLPKDYTPHQPSFQTWNAVEQSIKPGVSESARSIFIGLHALTGIDSVYGRRNKQLQPAQTQFNKTLVTATQFFRRLLERMLNGGTASVSALLKDPKASATILAATVSCDQETVDTAVEIIKNYTGEAVRRDALHDFALQFPRTFLNAFSDILHRISVVRAFTPTSRAVRVCTDILDLLCDAEDGLLSRNVLATIKAEDLSAVVRFWNCCWNLLQGNYASADDWSRNGQDKQVMFDFCRDTMQFSGRLFDSYVVFANAMTEVLSADEELKNAYTQAGEPKQLLLKSPAETIDVMVYWLRLKDEYLSSTFVTLFKKLLVQLTRENMTLADSAVSFLENVVKKDVRTLLSAPERAELRRSLEENLGRKLVDDDDVITLSDSAPQSKDVKNKQVKQLPSRIKPGQIDLAKWQSKAAENLGKAHPANTSFQEDLKSMSRSVELLKKQQTQKPAVAHSATVKAMMQPSVSKEVGGVRPNDEQLAFREKREREKQAKKLRDQELARSLRKGKQAISGPGKGGSALGGLGVYDKDHAPKAAGVMLSSESEAESDADDEFDRELFGAPAAEAKDAKASAASRAVPIHQGPVKKTKQIRTAKDMRARLVPDLTDLHKAILAWDPFSTSNFPPNSTRTDYTMVTQSFKTAMEYKRTFEPLLLLEAWQGFKQTVEEGLPQGFQIKVVSRLSVDSFLELSFVMDGEEIKKWGIHESDVFVLSDQRQLPPATGQVYSLARCHKINRKRKAIEISFRFVPGSGIQVHALPNASVWCTKLSSITPLEREYGALKGLDYYDLCDEIVRGYASPLLNYSSERLAQVGRNYQLNTAQAKAVLSAVDNDAFTLIQGPPGSGKTKTITAIVGALLSDSLKMPDDAVRVGKPSTGVASSSGNAMKKLLVCAPSNAAVDELVMRMMGGVKTLSGQFHKINVLRLGRSDAINKAVTEVTLDELVNKKLNLTEANAAKPTDELGQTMAEHKGVCEKLNELRDKLDAANASGAGQTPEQNHEFEVLKRRKQQLGSRIDQLKDNSNTAARNIDINRRKAQQEILAEAHVLCATLSGSGHEMFHNLNIDFETVVIDEAAQSIELSALIPLKYGCQKCIMVGDPKQLPPTVLSREAARFQYEQSLFVRMQTNRDADVHLLDIQYRMHPEISKFPSQAFYDSKLVDGPSMAEQRIRPWHQDKYLGPYRFYDVRGQQASGAKGHSLINIAEVDVALALYKRLKSSSAGFSINGKVGIITPYKSQLAQLRNKFRGVYGEDITRHIEFNTTDAFQGRESEVIIFSCVRASPTSIGFLSDIRRMNVGITRAKSSLWILGNTLSLMNGEFWRKLIENSKERERFIDGDIMAMLREPVSVKKLERRESAGGEAMEDVQMTGEPKRKMSTSSINHGQAVKPKTENGAAKIKKEEHSAPPKPKESSLAGNSNNHKKESKLDTAYQQMTSADLIAAKSKHNGNGVKRNRSPSSSSSSSSSSDSKEDKKQKSSTTTKPSTAEARSKPNAVPAPIKRPAIVTKRPRDSDMFIKKKPKRPPQ